MRMKAIIFLMVLATYGLAQDSRSQMSVRVADEESAAAPQTANAKPPSSPAIKGKKVAQSWPTPKPAPTKKKKSGPAQGGWGKSSK